MSYFQGNSIFWIEVGKIKTNPHQPRKEFDEEKLQSLSESVRQYGVLQPLVVTRSEVEKSDGGISTEYELIAGERRLRAARMANLGQVPVIIKSGEEDSLLKLELAIIENIQREDLNPIDRAVAFNRLVEEFKLKHSEVGKKVGKSREYVSNTLRLLTLPEEIREAVAGSKISEGHARTLMMLSDKPDELATVFKEVVYKNLSVRETESIARRIAHDKVRKKDRRVDPELVELEGKLSESLGTRVQIESRENGGKIMIDFFSPEDVKNIITLLSSSAQNSAEKYDMLSRFINSQQASQPETKEEPEETGTEESREENIYSEPQSFEKSNESDEEVKQTESGSEEEANKTPQYDWSSYLNTREEKREDTAPAADIPTYGAEVSHGEEESESTEEEPDLTQESDSEDKKEDDNDDELYSISNFNI
ncbi:MAG: ParB/RepB/Spo0J family partition protein [Candidatus Campbellbacteria bacterium]|nr:ParB/RepB/Spo0J family partition protein [Candidatus Campbellbacteria bacterium]